MNAREISPRRQIQTNYKYISPLNHIPRSDEDNPRQRIVVGLGTISRSLQNGTSGEDVRMVQEALAMLGYFKVQANGNFGPKTKAAVVDFQIAEGIIDNRANSSAGIFGPKTKLRLVSILQGRDQKREATSASGIMTTQTFTRSAVVRNIANSKKEWQEVSRESEVLVVGDLNGSYEALIKSLESLKVIDSAGNWIGENRRIVFLGDILGDRHTEGIQIMLKIYDLKFQASKSGGSATVIMGNHDDWAVSYLAGQKVAAPWRPNSRHAGYPLAPSWPARGLLEFQNQFGHRNFQELQDAFGKSAIPQEELLQIMRNDPEGRKLLSEICEMKLIVQVDDTLFTHTNPSSIMLLRIVELGIDAINTLYQKGLKQLLFEGVTPSKEWYEIRNIFLCTWDRKNFDNPKSPGYQDPNALSNKIRNLGINHIIYGHDDAPTKYYEIHNLSVINSDHSAFKKDSRSDDKRSITVIGEDGSVRCGSNLDIKRGGNI